MAFNIFNDGNDYNASDREIRKAVNSRIPAIFSTITSPNLYSIPINPFFPNAQTLPGGIRVDGLKTLPASTDGYAFQAVPQLSSNAPARNYLDAVVGFSADIQKVGGADLPGFPIYNGIGRTLTADGKATYASAVDYMGLTAAAGLSYGVPTAGDIGGAVFYPNATGGGKLFLPQAIAPYPNGTPAPAFASFGAFPQNIPYPQVTMGLPLEYSLPGFSTGSSYAFPDIRANYFGLNSVPTQFATPYLAVAAAPTQGYYAQQMLSPYANLGFAV